MNDSASRQSRTDEALRHVREGFQAPQGMTDEDSARLEMTVRGVGATPFPATRESLIDEARRSGDEELVVELRSLPEGATYPTLEDLLLALGVGMAGRIDVPGAPPRRPDAGPPIEG